MKKASSTERLMFLRDVLQNQVGYKEALDNKANILLGVSGVIFGLALTQLNSVISVALRLGLFALIVATGFSALLCIWTIKMPFSRHKTKQHLICYTGFSELDRDNYFSSMKKTLDNTDKIEEEYLTEIYGLAKNSIEPKYKLVSSSTSILTIGLIFGALLFVFSMAAA